jgi:hypothetical protein
MATRYPLTPVPSGAPNFSLVQSTSFYLKMPEELFDNSERAVIPRLKEIQLGLGREFPPGVSNFEMCIPLLKEVDGEDDSF